MGPGLDDPEAGNGGYQVTKDVIDLSWDAPTERVTATTTIHARTTQVLRSSHLDLALRADRVQVD